MLSFTVNGNSMGDESINTKKAAGEKAAEYIQPGMTVGLGTGSTAYWAIQAIGARVNQGLGIKAVATSAKSEMLGKELGIDIISFADIDHIDITIDGADEVSENLDLIKGGGGALLREKIVGYATRQYIIIADYKKYVKTLGAFALPVEVVKFGWEMTIRHLQKLGCTTKTRIRDEESFITENGNYIIDCSFVAIKEPTVLYQQINAIPGVVENGLFLQMADIVVLGEADGSTRILTRNEV
ncbi:MAG: ribose-5-phosphate isomerase RpiA [Chitinophagaceae bacterium]